MKGLLFMIGFLASSTSLAATIPTRVVEISKEHGKEILKDHIPDILSHLREFYDKGGIHSADLSELFFHAAVAIQEKAGVDEQYIPEILIILFNAYAGYDQVSVTIERLSTFRTVNFIFAGFSSLAAYEHVSELMSSTQLKEFFDALFLVQPAS